jgi:hypothetical protein
MRLTSAIVLLVRTVGASDCSSDQKRGSFQPEPPAAAGQAQPSASQPAEQASVGSADEVRSSDGLPEKTDSQSPGVDVDSKDAGGFSIQGAVVPSMVC